MATVYFARQPGLSAFDPDEPETLLDYAARHRADSTTGSFWQCPSVTGVMRSTIVFRSPVDTACDFATGEVTGEAAWAIGGHAPGMAGCGAAWVSFTGVIAVADTPMVGQWTSPWFHEVQHTRFGMIVPGQFDIGQWVRPMNFEFNTWAGISRIQLAKGEPIAYLQLMTDEPVQFKAFDMPAELLELSDELSNSARTDPRKTLAERYAKLANSQRLADLKRQLGIIE